MAISVLDLFELLEQRFDAHRHLAPRDLPLPLLALEAPVLRGQHGVLPAQPVLQLAHAPRQLVALLTESIVVGAQLLDHPGGPLDAVRQAVEIRKSGGRGLAHRSLNRPPHCFTTASTIRSWMAWTSDSVRVRSGCWNWSANARLFIPSSVPGPTYTSNSSIEASCSPAASMSTRSTCPWVVPCGRKNARSRRTGGNRPGSVMPVFAAVRRDRGSRSATNRRTVASISQIRSTAGLSVPAQPMREVPLTTSALTPGFQPSAA